MQDRHDARSMQGRLREVAGRACVTERACPTGRQARGVRRGRPLRVRCGGAGRVRRPSASPRLPTFCCIAANSGSGPEAAIHRSFESGGDGSISTPGLSCRKAGKARGFPPARESSGNPGFISKKFGREYSGRISCALFSAMSPLPPRPWSRVCRAPACAQPGPRPCRYAGAGGTRNTRSIVKLKLCPPMAPGLQRGSGDFGTSPFSGNGAARN